MAAGVLEVGTNVNTGASFGGTAHPPDRCEAGRLTFSVFHNDGLGLTNKSRETVRDHVFIGTTSVASPIFPAAEITILLATLSARLLARCRSISSSKRSFRAGLVFLSLRT
jgi:hypothetical protein